MDVKFNKFVVPTQPISSGSELVHGIRYNATSGQMTRHGVNVDAVPKISALTDFLTYLRCFDKPVLMGHGIGTFDVPILLNQYHDIQLMDNFSSLGQVYMDTLVIARELIPPAEVPNFKLSSLVSQYTNVSVDHHDARMDAFAVQELFYARLQHITESKYLYPILYPVYYDSFNDLLTRKRITYVNAIQLAKSGLSLRHVYAAYELDGENGMSKLLSQTDVTGRPRVDDVPNLVKLFASLITDSRQAAD